MAPGAGGGCDARRIVSAGVATGRPEINLAREMVRSYRKFLRPDLSPYGAWPKLEDYNLPQLTERRDILISVPL